MNGWHLFLKDMSATPGGKKMSAVLAEQLGSHVRFARAWAQLSLNPVASLATDALPCAGRCARVRAPFACASLLLIF
jgi:hypothetical protein